MCPPVEETPAANGQSNGTNGTNGENSHPGFSAVRSTPTKHVSPYQPVGDYLSNVGRFKIIESTLREGEQFAKYVFFFSHLSHAPSHPALQLEIRRF